jgi:DNA repair protein RadC
MENLPLLNPSLDDTDEQILAKADRILRSKLRDGLFVTDPEIAGRMLRYRLAGRDREYFSAVLLDTRHWLIEVVDLHASTIDSAEVHPREVARLALITTPPPSSSATTTPAVTRNLPLPIER